MGSFLNWIDNLVWGVPLILFLLFTGIYLSIRLRFLQFRLLKKAFRYLFHKEKSAHGEISGFAALCTALSATIGTGNMVGVATAICQGGPGALFWMVIAALFGMATKYSEGLLAVKYRVVAKNGHVLGGPFYYIENGMGKKYKWLGILFAIFGMCVGLFGIGTFTQVNSITSAVSGFFDPNMIHMVSFMGTSVSIVVIISELLLTMLVATVLIGGLYRIARVAQVLVPFMAIAYILICLVFLAFNITAIPHALVVIVKDAFGANAIAGGAMGTMMIAMQKGIARGIFSNEAGLGSAPIAAAAARTNEPAKQGLVSMIGTFVDTVIICSMTGLCIVIAQTYNVGLEGIAVTTKAFQSGLPLPNQIVSFLIMACLIIFAFTTILGWDYYGERCTEYLFGGKMKVVMAYKILYIAAVFIGPFMTISAVWTIADIFNGLMALPNLIALLFLSPIIIAETKKFIKKDFH
ncbi:MAG: sodium:alanine symporter family protein [Lentisphaeria bacterium]